MHAVFINAPPRAQSAIKATRILDAIADNVEQEFVSFVNEMELLTMKKQAYKQNKSFV